MTTTINPASGSTPASPGSTPASPGRSQRERILDITLALMAERGASGTSMRTLAAACELNVAALYHYFPSKDALLRAVIEERRYDVALGFLPVPDLGLAPHERLTALILAIWDGAQSEAPIWRLLLSEALHGDTTAREVGADLRRSVQATLEDAVPRVVPEIAAAPDVAGRTIAGALFALMIESTLLDAVDVTTLARHRADDLATLLLP